MKKTLYILSIIFFLLVSCSPREQIVSLSGSTMGTRLSIKISTTSIDYIKNTVKPGIDSLLIDVNQQMSTYIPDSELSKFNSFQDTVLFTTNTELVQLVKKSLEISQETDGAFDITVGPLVNLWGFGPEKTWATIPSQKTLDQRKNYTGFEKLIVHDNGIQKHHPKLYCDLSAIAKGYGVDKVADYIEQKGHNNYLVEIGGEIRAAGIKPNRAKWGIGISTPEKNSGIQKIIRLTDIGMATSGDYQNYFEKDGIRYSHTINPKTGKPITHKLASVTVLHESCKMADAYATAINVMGPEKGLEFAQKMKLAAFFLVKSDTGFVEQQTKEFERYLK